MSKHGPNNCWVCTQPPDETQKEIEQRKQVEAIIQETGARRPSGPA